MVLLSFLVSLIITVVYKYTTNQELMKDLKAEIKEFQSQLKELKNKPEEFMKVQQEAMRTNMKYMGHSFRATIFTIIPIIFIFGWMNAHFTYDAINPGDEFTVTLEFQQQVSGDITLQAPAGITIDGSGTKELNGDNVFWTLSGEEGTHTLTFDYNGEKHERDVLITSGNDYLPRDVDATLVGSDLEVMRVDLEKKKIFNLLGWKLGWLGTYIIFSILFSIGLRKALRVY